MKLSEAMMLGSVTCKMEQGNLDSCAFGSALNAIGCKEEGMARWVSIAKAWPWTTVEDTHCLMTNLACTIYEKFDLKVCCGEMTLEQLADYVKTIEPSCGECNRFDCPCVKAEAAPVAELVTA
jgi:hypothetical protein